MYISLNSFTKKILPNWMYSRLVGNWNAEGLKKYSHQAGWLLLARLISFALSFFMIALVARYLGPENLGKLNYAQSFIALFSLFASLGISQLVARDLTAHPEREYEILGTAFYLKLIFGTLTAIAVGITAYLTSTDPILTWLILIISLTFIIQPLGVASDIFVARVQGKYTAYTQIILSFIIQAAKLLIILFGKGILFFAGILVIEAFLSALLSLFFYIKIFKRSPLKWSWDTTYAKTLIIVSTPLLFAGVSSYIFGQIDKVMIQPLLGSAAVGFYTSAVTVTQILAGMIPGIIIGALTPALINAYKSDRDTYRRRLRALIILSSLISLSIASIIFLLAQPVISVIYGSAFAPAVPILHIFIWSTVLATIMNIINQHFIITSKTKTFLVISLVTALINIGLNYYLIPLHGTIGAAYATLVSFAAYISISLWVYLRTKPN